MAKIIRFKSADQREWNQNQSMVVNPNNTIVRPVTPKEQLTMFQVSKHIGATAKPFSTKTPDEDTTVEGRLTKLPGSTKSRIDFFIDGLAVRGGRELIKERLFTEHGSCLVYGINGKFLSMVRDPDALSKMKTAQSSGRASSAPSPDVCICKNWALSNGQPHPGKHHPVCQFNDQAPPEERGSFNDVGGEPDRAVPATSPVPVAAALPAAPVVPSVPSPGDCHCKAWALPDGSAKPADKHHPICEHREKWESMNPDGPDEPGEKYLIVNLNPLSPMREATPDEVNQALAEEEKSGVMMITIDGDVYGVMLESDIKAAVT